MSQYCRPVAPFAAKDGLESVVAASLLLFGISWIYVTMDIVATASRLQDVGGVHVKLRTCDFTRDKK
jgi:hypothetical protein